MTAVALGPKTSQELVFKAVKNRKRCGLYFVGFVDRQKVRPIDRSLFFSKIMHQSIPAVPTPRAIAGHLLTFSVLGMEHSQFYRRPGTGH